MNAADGVKRPRLGGLLFAKYAQMRGYMGRIDYFHNVKDYHGRGEDWWDDTLLTREVHHHLLRVCALLAVGN